MASPSPNPRVSYPEAARALLRTSILDAMRELLGERDWSRITLGDVAGRAGVSRQTLYKEFGSRAGLAQAYALRLADQLVDHVEAAIWLNVGDPRAAVRDGLTNFFIDAAEDPLIQSLLTGEVKLDLLRLITLDSEPLVDRAADRLTRTFVESWVRAPVAEAGALARALVRIALSFIPAPPRPDQDVPGELALVLAPFVEQLVAGPQPTAGEQGSGGAADRTR
ncbi:TetR/AcrR family transcriptional regulator [Skermania piniformis]|uniref:TetR family transcriptional regulator n=1 Tax=Skermania pinensis TaxID=39122 RepID=A0ABX8S9N0_9ACTN|nr:TetR family transcriptional regulator [Skermania piniformis]QXQ13265.1 TetR family transcriptional regulator [Skermania piniformis]